MLESVYGVVLASELSSCGLVVERQVPVPIVYKGRSFEEGFRADIIVAGKVLLELKSVERVTPAHKKQVQPYLRLTGLKPGYLLNFGEAVLKDGITRCVNRLEEEIPQGRGDMKLKKTPRLGGTIEAVEPFEASDFAFQNRHRHPGALSEHTTGVLYHSRANGNPH